MNKTLISLLLVIAACKTPNPAWTSQTGDSDSHTTAISITSNTTMIDTSSSSSSTSTFGTTISTLNFEPFTTGENVTVTTNSATTDYTEPGTSTGFSTTSTNMTSTTGNDQNYCPENQEISGGECICSFGYEDCDDDIFNELVCCDIGI